MLKMMMKIIFSASSPNIFYSEAELKIPTKKKNKFQNETHGSTNKSFSLSYSCSNLLEGSISIHLIKLSNYSWMQLIILLSIQLNYTNLRPTKEMSTIFKKKLKEI